MSRSNIANLWLSLRADGSGLKKDVDKNMKSTALRMEAAGKAIGAATTAALAAGGVALVEFTRRTINAAQELANLSRLSGTQAKQFQILARGAKPYGIEQEKLADILKDTNDKIGDFMQTGAGPMKDFFENVAPLVGVTKEQFQGLSSDQALGLYVKSLQEANLSQRDMTFYMEAIASDSTALIPLFQDNAKELREIEAAAEAAGDVVDTRFVKAMADLKKEMEDTAASIQGKFSNMVGSVIYDIQLIRQVSRDEREVRKQALENMGLGGGRRAPTAAMKRRAAERMGYSGFAEAIEAEMEKVRKAEIEAAQAAFREQKKLNEERLKTERNIQAETEFQAAQREAQNQLLERQNELRFDGLSTAEQVAELEFRIAELMQITGDESVSYDKRNEALKEQADLQLKLLDITKRHREESEKPIRDSRSGFVVNNSFAGAQRFLGLDQPVPLDPTNNPLAGMMNREAEMLAQHERERAFILEQTQLTEDEKQKLIDQANERHLAKLQQFQQAKQSMILQTNASMFGDLANITKAFAGDQSGIYQALFAVNKAFAIADSIISITQGIAKAASGKFPENLGAMAAVTSATAGLVSTIQSTELSFEKEGSFKVPGVSRTGGSDGRGGVQFTAHPYEQVDVYDLRKGRPDRGGKGITIVMHNTFTVDVKDTVQEQIEQATPMIADKTRAAIEDASYRGF